MTRGGAPGGVTSPASSASSTAKLQLPQSCDPPGPTNPPKQRVWIIFGGSGHIGRSVLKAALTHGDLVTAVGKLHEDTTATMAGLVGPPTPAKRSMASPSSPRSTASSKTPPADARYPHPHPRYQPLVCDVRVPSSVAAVVAAARARWGRIDVIANCTGYGVIGACEDQDDADIRGQLETNFFGTLNIIQASLPYFRARGSGKSDGAVASPSDDSDSYEASDESTAESDAAPKKRARRRARPAPRRRGGRYLIFSSTSGALGVPGLGPYCATKYAVEGLVESLLYEIDAFGIRATLVEPGHVRRDDVPDDLGHVAKKPKTSRPEVPQPQPGSLTSVTSALPTFGHFFVKPPSQPYAGANAPAAHARRMVQWLGDRQPTSVVKAAELVWQLGHCRYPPLRLLLGTYAVDSVRDRLRTIIEEIEDWKFLNFGGQPPGAAGDGKNGDEQMDADAEYGATGAGGADKADDDEHEEHNDEEEEGEEDEEEDEDGDDDEDMPDADINSRLDDMEEDDIPSVRGRAGRAG